MTFDINKAAAWVGLATAFGAGVGWWRSSVVDAQHLQQAKDYFYQRIGNDEAEIAVIKKTLPADKQELLDAIQTAQDRAQRQDAAAEKQAVFYEGAKMVHARIDIPASADAPAVEAPAAIEDRRKITAASPDKIPR